MLDLVLAIVHHLLIFGIFGVLFAEFILLRPGMSHVSAVRMASIDMWYGVFAGVVVIIGFCRAIFAAKGWPYYSHNTFFWAKIATFAAIGLVSVRPTIAFIGWRRSSTAPDIDAIRAARRCLHIELALFVLLPIFAAAMARGYGEF
jgi:putative membrane protein